MVVVSPRWLSAQSSTSTGASLSEASPGLALRRDAPLEPLGVADDVGAAYLDFEAADASVVAGPVGEQVRRPCGAHAAEVVGVGEAALAGQAHVPVRPFHVVLDVVLAVDQNSAGVPLAVLVGQTVCLTVGRAPSKHKANELGQRERPLDDGRDGGALRDVLPIERFGPAAADALLFVAALDRLDLGVGVPVRLHPPYLSRPRAASRS